MRSKSLHFARLRLGALLAERGFRRDGNTWQMRINDVFHSIEFQKSRDSDSLLINLYIGISPIHDNIKINYKAFGMCVRLDEMIYHLNRDHHRLILNIQDFERDIDESERVHGFATIFDYYIGSFFSKYSSKVAIYNDLRSDCIAKYVGVHRALFLDAGIEI
jgi:hypothetical protein